MTERTRETHVVIPLEQALILGANAALLVAVGMLLVRRWGGSAYGWLDIVLMVAGAFGLGFAGWWLFTMYILRPSRPQPPEPMRMAAPVPMPSERIIPVFTQRANPEVLKENERELRFAAFLRACESSTASRHLAKDFTPAEVEDFRGVLFTLGVADWNGAEPRQGWRLLMAVQEIAARLRIEL